MATYSTLLQDVTQGKHESLRQYMANFAKACLNTLFAEPPSNMDELWACPTKYITIEENTQVVRRT